jgi:hypothetical protein
MAGVAADGARAGNTLTVKAYKDTCSWVKTGVQEASGAYEGAAEVELRERFEVRGVIKLANTRLKQVCQKATQVTLTQIYAYELSPLAGDEPMAGDPEGRVVSVDFPLADCEGYRNGDDTAELLEAESFLSEPTAIRSFDLAFEQDGKDVRMGYTLIGQHLYYSRCDKSGSTVVEQNFGRYSIAELVGGAPSQSAIGQAMFRLEVRPGDASARHTAGKRIHLATRFVRSGDTSWQCTITGVPWSEK